MLQTWCKSYARLFVHILWNNVYFFFLAAVTGIEESAVTEENDLDPSSGRISGNFLSLARYVSL